MGTEVLAPRLDASSGDQTARSTDKKHALGHGLRVLWFVGVGVFVVQLVLLLIHSDYLWTHFDLTADFGQYSQAWQQIATGHLNPYDTTYPWYYPHYGYPFYQADLELIMWPLSLLYWLWPTAFDLLVVQDIALAGAGLVAFRWVLDHLERNSPNQRLSTVAAVSTLAILVLQPWTYWAASYDYHSEPLAVLFTVLAGRDFWSGRRRGWIWTALVLACGNVAATYVAALGIAALISGRHRWRLGLGLVAVGVAWLTVVGLVHSGKGATLGGYAYIAGSASLTNGLSGVTAIVGGMIAHPTRVWHVLSGRWSAIYKFPAGAGTVGLFSAVGFAFSVVVLAPSALNTSLGYLDSVGGSQNLMAVIACAIGVSMLVTWIARFASAADDGRGGRSFVKVGATIVAFLLPVAALVQTAVMSAHWIPLSGQTFERVGAPAAHRLGALDAQIPTTAETIVSQGVVGRFAQRRNFYPYLDVYPNGQTVPIYGRHVYVILVPSQGVESESAQTTRAAVELMRRLGAVQLNATDGVYAFKWRVPRGVHSITFPP
jgi:Predicted membrane protein (DUF2079)